MPDTPEQCATRLEAQEAAVSRAFSHHDYDATLKLLQELSTDVDKISSLDQKFNNEVFRLVQAHDRVLDLPSLIIVGEEDGKIHLDERLGAKFNKLEIETAPARLEKELKQEHAKSFEDAVQKDAQLINKGLGQNDTLNEDLRHHIHSACSTGGWRGQKRYFEALNGELQKMNSPYRIIAGANTSDYWNKPDQIIGWYSIEKNGKKVTDNISY